MGLILAHHAVDCRRREGAVIRLRLVRRFLFRFLFRPLPYPGSALPVHLTRPFVRPSDHPFALPPLDPFTSALFVSLFVHIRIPFLPPPFFSFLSGISSICVLRILIPYPMGSFVITREAV